MVCWTSGCWGREGERGYAEQLAGEIEVLAGEVVIQQEHAARVAGGGVGVGGSGWV